MIEGCLARLSLLREHGQALLDQSSGFPGLECNCRRALASLKMMEINLGLLTVPAGARPENQG